jgi:hypothetical protein
MGAGPLYFEHSEIGRRVESNAVLRGLDRKIIVNNDWARMFRNL